MSDSRFCGAAYTDQMPANYPFAAPPFCTLDPGHAGPHRDQSFKNVSWANEGQPSYAQAYTPEELANVELHYRSQIDADYHIDHFPTEVIERLLATAKQGVEQRTEVLDAEGLDDLIYRVLRENEPHLTMPVRDLRLIAERIVTALHPALRAAAVERGVSETPIDRAVTLWDKVRPFYLTADFGGVRSDEQAALNAFIDAMDDLLPVEEQSGVRTQSSGRADTQKASER